MKCVNCDYEFYSKETLERGICPACGKSLTVKDATPDIWRAPAEEPDATVLLKAQVSNAINTRRIALVLILAVALSVGSALVSMIVSIYLADEWDTTHFNTARAILGAWVLVAAVIMIFGACYILFQKRLTSLGSALGKKLK